MGWQLLRVIVTDQDGGEVVKQGVDGVGTGAVEASNCRESGRCRRDRRQRGKQGTACARETEETAAPEVDEEAVAGENPAPKMGRLTAATWKRWSA